MGITADDANKTTDKDESIIRISGDNNELADVKTIDSVERLCVDTGVVATVPDALSDLLFTFAKNGTNTNMNVDGSVTPVEFTVDALTSYDYFINEIRFTLIASSIQMGQFGPFAALTNGVELDIISEGNNLTLFDPFTTTDDLMYFDDGTDGNISVQPGRDSIRCILKFANPFKLDKNSSDEIKVTINDDLDGVQLYRFDFLAKGFKK